MNNWYTALPLPLGKLNKLNYAFAEGEGIDFEPFESFLSGKEYSSSTRLNREKVLAAASSLNSEFEEKVQSLCR